MLAKAMALTALAVGGWALPASNIERNLNTNLNIKLSVADGLLNSNTDGRIVLMFAPNGTNPLDNTDVTSSPNLIFGKNVYDFGPKSSVTLSGGSNDSTATSVFGWPSVSMDDIAPGTYSVQAFLTRYETVTRSDGSKVSLRFPCGDGGLNVDGFGSLTTPFRDISITGGAQSVDLVFTNITAVKAFPGNEIGGCNQGNYKDTDTIKYIKLRSSKLSKFWGRDMYVGANVVLPAGYNSGDNKTHYPVIYNQGHWLADLGAYFYGADEDFTATWDAGIIPATNTTAERPVPKFVLVTFRHEAPYYDDSYAVNTANLGPYGEAINEELIPHIEKTFRIIRSPHARVQDGGSTGGWESIANLIYRPDLFGVCFTYYPDSLDFHRHQDIELYTAANAYVRADGSNVPSIRTFVNGTQVVLATVAQENHWELTFGTASRSFNQWDIWNAVFGAQGYNGYPLEPWDKVTGEIYPEAVQYWKPFDLSDYVVTNFNSSRNLGAALADRIFISVGTWDDYFLNEGVVEFQKRTDAVGGPGWANVTILPETPHGGWFRAMDIWDYLELVEKWVNDHAPDGPNPLPASAVAPSIRGNVWEDVLAHGGREAAVKRQADPKIEQDKVKVGQTVTADVGRWDPGVKLSAQWVLNGKPVSKSVSVGQGGKLTYAAAAKGHVQLLVTGEKRNYATETRKSQRVLVGP